MRKINCPNCGRLLAEATEDGTFVHRPSNRATARITAGEIECGRCHYVFSVRPIPDGDDRPERGVLRFGRR